MDRVKGMILFGVLFVASCGVAVGGFQIQSIWIDSLDVFGDYFVGGIVLSIMGILGAIAALIAFIAVYRHDEGR